MNKMFVHMITRRMCLVALAHQRCSGGAGAIRTGIKP
jgi:hypothetical protein